MDHGHRPRCLVLTLDPPTPAKLEDGRLEARGLAVAVITCPEGQTRRRHGG
jgi:hypothetical protein